jgi:O-antigen/teichoic acid export membrane protein
LRENAFEMNKDRFFLAVTLSSRVVIGFASLMALARTLGPADYGFMATILAYSQIAAMLTDFGFGVQALRDIGAEPDRAGELIAACIRVKNFLVAMATALVVGVLLTRHLSSELFSASLMLYGSIMVMSYGDMAIMALRGIGRFDVEAYAAWVGVVLFLIIVVGTALLKPQILALSTALLLARIGQAVLFFSVVGRFVRFGNCVFGRLRDIIRFARDSSGLALDTILSVIPAQLDTVFVSSLLGLHAAGTYQVASRLANYVQLPIQILAQVYMPRLAHSIRNDPAESARLERFMVLEFAGIGLALGFAFALLAPTLTPYAFGKEYVVPLDLWVAFAISFFVTSIAAALGVALVAHRDIFYRVVGQLVSVTTIVIGFWFFLPTFGLVAAPGAVIAGLTLSAILYIWRLLLLNRRWSAHSHIEIRPRND